VDAHEGWCSVDLSVDEDGSLFQEFVIGGILRIMAFKAEDAKVPPTSWQACVCDLNDLGES